MKLSLDMPEPLFLADAASAKPAALTPREDVLGELPLSRYPPILPPRADEASVRTWRGAATLLRTALAIPDGVRSSVTEGLSADFPR